MRIVMTLLVSPLLVAAVATAGENEFGIREASVSAGAGQLEQGSFGVVAALGVPAAGSLSGGEFSLAAGIVPAQSTPGELVFVDGFESPASPGGKLLSSQAAAERKSARRMTGGTTIGGQ